MTPKMMLRINILFGIILCCACSGCLVVTVASTAVSVGATAVDLGVTAGSVAVKATAATAKGVAKVTGLSSDEKKPD